MQVLITGGCGFLGLRLAKELNARAKLCGQPIGQIILTDLMAPAGPLPPGISFRQADIGETGQVLATLPPGPLTVFHLASVVSAGGEKDFDGAIKTNLDGGRLLLEALRQRGDEPRLIFASSVAIFSGKKMGDEVKPLPATTYGMTKVVLELLINDMSRKGFIDGRSARLPTVIIRPGKPNAAASGYASGLFREPLAGLPHALPVPRDTAILVGGYAGVIENLIRFAELPGEALGLDRALTFPSLSVTAEQMIEALRQAAAGRRLGPISDAPDPAITAIVRSWPSEADFARALSLGLVRDPDLVSIVKRYIADYLEN